jgi:hypothetical protein
VAALRSLGNGVAFACSSPALADVRAGIADQWAPFLIPQDAAGWWPHVTVANKLAPAAARALLATLAADFAPCSFAAAGLALWRYDGGPWCGLGEWRFGR